MLAPEQCMQTSDIIQIEDSVGMSCLTMIVLSKI